MASAEIEVREQVKFNWFRMCGLLALLVSLGLAVPLSIGGLEALSLFVSLPLWAFPALLLAMLLAWNLNLLRLRVLLDSQIKDLGYWRMMRIYMATEFVSKTTPMGAGAPAAAVWLLAPHGVKPISCLVIFGVSACMDAIVLVGLMGCFLVGGFAVSLGASLWLSLFLVAAIMLAVIIGTALLLYRHKLLFCILVSTPGFSLAGPKGRRLARKLIVSLHLALRRISGLPWWRLIFSWTACLFYWALYLSTLYLCIWVMGGGVSWIESGFVQTIAMGVGHILMVPGGAGGSEVSGTLLLEPALGATLAATVILLWRFLMLYLYLIVGGLAMISLIRAGSES